MMRSDSAKDLIEGGLTACIDKGTAYKVRFPTFAQKHYLRFVDRGPNVNQSEK
jgi:hypothetical protein